MIKVVAKHFVQEDKLNDFLNNVKELIYETRKEEGCIKYELYQDEKYPRILTIIEEWADETVLKKHMTSEHFRSILPILSKFMEKQGELNIYKKIL